VRLRAWHVHAALGPDSGVRRRARNRADRRGQRRRRSGPPRAERPCRTARVEAMARRGGLVRRGRPADLHACGVGGAPGDDAHPVRRDRLASAFRSVGGTTAGRAGPGGRDQPEQRAGERPRTTTLTKTDLQSARLGPTVPPAWALWRSESPLRVSAPSSGRQEVHRLAHALTMAAGPRRKVVVRGALTGALLWLVAAPRGRRRPAGRTTPRSEGARRGGRRRRCARQPGAAPHPHSVRSSRRPRRTQGRRAARAHRPRPRAVACTAAPRGGEPTAAGRAADSTCPARPAARPPTPRVRPERGVQCTASATRTLAGSERAADHRAHQARSPGSRRRTRLFEANRTRPAGSRRGLARWRA